MSSLDLYKVLQVDPAAEPEVLRAAFVSLAKKYHPDSGQGDGARMTALNEAWEVLGDPARRAAYDRARNSGSSHRAPSPRTDEPPGAGDSLVRPTPGSAARPHASGSIVDFGRYAGWPLEAIAREDPEYLEWLARAQIGRQFRTEIYAILAARAAAGVPIGRPGGGEAAPAARDSRAGWGTPWRRAWAQR